MISNIGSAALATLLPLACLGAEPAAAATQAVPGKFTTLYHFSQSQNGEADVEGTLEAFGAALYGTAGVGGSAGKGTVFRFDLASHSETTLFSFTGGNKEGAFPFGPLSRVGASIYGSTTEGHGTGPGSNGNYTGYGTIWRLNAHGGQTRVFHGFNGTDGSQPFSGVTPAEGLFYGVTWYGGPANTGTVFKLDRSGTLTQLYAFPDNSIGCNPLDAVAVAKTVLYGTTTFCGGQNSGTVFSLDLQSGKASLLHTFAANGNGTASPNAVVYQGGAVYGTTFYDGGAGDVYKIDVNTRQYSVLHQFSGGADGSTPTSGLTPFKGKLYGVTEAGGVHGCGTIYSIDPATGSYAIDYSFTCGGDGDTPFAGLLANGGALYGSTLNIASEYPNPRGSLFKFAP